MHAENPPKPESSDVEPPAPSAPGLAEVVLPTPPSIATSVAPRSSDVSDSEHRRISELYESLNRIDHYRLLGVAATDDAKAIKRAYFALAKEHHPDRWFRKDIGALKKKVEAIFNALSAAEQVLTSPTRRAEYDAYLRDVLKTRIVRRQADALESAKSWTAAAEAWSRIVEQLPTDPYVQHRYAYALLRSGESYDVALAAATRAIDLDSTRAEYRVTAASLHLADGRDRSALAQLAVACEIDPDRADIAGLSSALSARIARSR